MTTDTQKFMTITIDVDLLTEVADHQLVGDIQVKLPGGQAIDFKRSSGSFDFMNSNCAQDPDCVAKELIQQLEFLLYGAVRNLRVELEEHMAMEKVE